MHTFWSSLLSVASCFCNTTASIVSFNPKSMQNVNLSGLRQQRWRRTRAKKLTEIYMDSNNMCDKSHHNLYNEETQLYFTQNMPSTSQEEASMRSSFLCLETKGNKFTFSTIYLNPFQNWFTDTHDGLWKFLCNRIRMTDGAINWMRKDKLNFVPKLIRIRRSWRRFWGGEFERGWEVRKWKLTVDNKSFTSYPQPNQTEHDFQCFKWKSWFVSNFPFSRSL